jgi:hypothetical protein
MRLRKELPDGRDLCRFKIGDKRFPYIREGGFGIENVTHPKNYAVFVSRNNHSREISVRFPSQVFNKYKDAYAKQHNLFTETNFKIWSEKHMINVCESLIKMTQEEVDSMIMEYLMSGDKDE